MDAAVFQDSLRQKVEPGTLTSVSTGGHGGDEVRVQELQVLFQIKIDVAPSPAGS